MRDTPKRVAIIGAGQLDSRYLQGLTKIRQGNQITVVDPNPAALETAKKRYHEMPGNPLIRSVAYRDSLEQFDEPLELAIIATNADVRRDVIETLIGRSRARYLILEKVVFQSIVDFEEVMSLLKDRGIQAWVNCARRMYPFFKELKIRTVNSRRVSLTVEGSNWGLACNAIHILDLLAFLPGQTKFNVVASNLDRQVYDTNRK